MSGDAPSMSEKIELFAASSYTFKRKIVFCEKDSYSVVTPLSSLSFSYRCSAVLF